MPGRLEIHPVEGLPEIEAGADLGALIAAATRLRDGDVVVVTSKAMSKAEGRVVAVDPVEREAARGRLVAAESRRIVARRGPLVIAETVQGLVCANAGVDGSNLPGDRLALLPADPDGSAAGLRDALAAATGRRVAVVVTDTFGRPWRAGLVNVAIGVAGMPGMRDHRGEKDGFGNVLEATVIAVADEIASAAELVMGKTSGVPVAVVRGLAASGEGSARELLRPPGEDLFRTGPVEAIEARRSIRAFDGRPVPREIVERAVEAAATSAVPDGAGRWRFVWLRSPDARASFTAAGGHPGLPGAPVLLMCVVDLPAQGSARDASLAGAGAAIQSLMVSLAAQGVGSWWAPVPNLTVTGGATTWPAIGCVAAGYAAAEASPRAVVELPEFLGEA